jgi:hypothetical protein
VSGAGERWTVNEQAALIAYEAQHSTCDIQKHPWQAVFGAGFVAGADDLRTRLAASAARVRELTEIASGMSACVEAMNTNQAWFSRSRIAFTLRDSLRAWADKYAALSGGSAVPEETSHAK